MSIRRIVSAESADWRIAEFPVWREDNEVDWTLPCPDGHHLAFLLIDEQHHVPTRSVSSRTIRRLLTLSAVRSCSHIDIEFDPAAQRLLIHDLAVWRESEPGQWSRRSELRPGAFILRQREQQMEHQMLNGRVSVVALLEDVRVGDAIELSWTIEPNESLEGTEFSAYVSMAWPVPVGRAYFTFHIDSGDSPRWVMHVPSGKSAPEAQVKPGLIKWRVERPPVAMIEPNTPGHVWPWPFLEASMWSDWREVAAFLSTQWADALTSGADEIAAQASLLRSPDDADASIRAAIRFVQEEIRYQAIDFGAGGGVIPNRAEEVLRRRFGDCKDKAVLLSAIIRAMGYIACPVLVAPNWRGAVSQVLPSLNAFSHVIVAFQEVEGGKKFFVDPTFLGQGGDLDHLVPPPYERGLEIHSTTEELAVIPSRCPAEITLTENFHLDPVGGGSSVEQEWRATTWLADSLRASIVRDGRAAFFRARADLLKQQFPALVFADGSGEAWDDVANNVLVLRAKHQLPTWGPVGKPPPSRFSYGAHGLLMIVENIEGPQAREQPWELPYPASVRHRVIVRGSSVRQVTPEKHKVEGPGFEYTCDLVSKVNEVTFDYLWKTLLPHVPPEQWPAYNQQRKKAFENTGANVATPGAVSAEGKRWTELPPPRQRRK